MKRHCRPGPILWGIDNQVLAIDEKVVWKAKTNPTVGARIGPPWRRIPKLRQTEPATEDLPLVEQDVVLHDVEQGPRRDPVRVCQCGRDGNDRESPQVIRDIAAVEGTLPPRRGRRRTPHRGGWTRKSLAAEDRAETALTPPQRQPAAPAPQTPRRLWRESEEGPPPGPDARV